VEDMWKYGDKQEVAHQAGITPQRLSAILRGTSRPSPELAARIEVAAAQFGITLTRLDLLYPQESANPYMLVATDDKP